MAVNGDTTYLLDTYELELIKNKHIEIETKPLGQNLLVNLQTPFGVPIEKQCVKGGVLDRHKECHGYSKKEQILTPLVELAYK